MYACISNCIAGEYADVVWDFSPTGVQSRPMTGWSIFLVFPTAIVIIRRVYTTPVPMSISRQKLLVWRGAEGSDLVGLMKVEQNLLKYDTRKMEVWAH
jgi:hypothetical protein